MEYKIKQLVNKYYKDVEKDIIGCGLNWSANDLIKKEVTEMITSVFNDIVGEMPNRNLDSDEYEVWYKKALVFGEIVRTMGEKYGRYISNFSTPTNLQSHYGPRD